jgi:hypothetical protein
VTLPIKKFLERRVTGHLKIYFSDKRVIRHLADWPVVADDCESMIHKLRVTNARE